MTKQFKVEMYVTVVSDQYPPDKMQEFLEHLFGTYRYQSMITQAVVNDCEVTDMEDM